jgi:hypothetical protein
MTSIEEDEGFMHFCIRTLKGLEPSIPGLHERMIIRTLRLLLENCITELCSCEANSWERTVEIFVEMRNAIGALQNMNPPSNASRLCSAIRKGLYTDERSVTDIVDNNTTDLERVRFFVAVYEGVGESLDDLTGDQVFMLSMGDLGPYAFAVIISRIRFMVQMGKNFIEDILTVQVMDAVD